MPPRETYERLTCSLSKIIRNEKLFGECNIIIWIRIKK